MEVNQFPYNGHLITVTLDEIKPAQVDIINPAGSHYRYFTKVPMPTKFDGGSVVVVYVQQLLDAAGFVKDTKTQAFNATTQEVFPYFYNMTLNGVTLGRKLETMMINGLLTHLLTRLLGNPVTQLVCFDSVGVFYLPIWFNHTATGNGFVTREATVMVRDANGFPTGNFETKDIDFPLFDVALNVADGAGDEYWYRLLNSNLPTQTSNVFPGLERGTYTFMVTSLMSMPCIRTLTI